MRKCRLQLSLRGKLQHPFPTFLQELRAQFEGLTQTEMHPLRAFTQFATQEIGPAA